MAQEISYRLRRYSILRMVNKISIDDIDIETINLSLPLNVPTFIINDGNLLKKNVLEGLPYRFLLISSKRRLDFYTPYYHEAIDSRFATFGGKGREYANILINEICPNYLIGVDSKNIYYGGISLGGLHSVYSSTLDNFPICNFFSICGSFWFPGFVNFLKENLKAENKHFYLLNGKKEGLNHPNTPLSLAYPSAKEVAKILEERNEVGFIGDNYSHHDHLTERFLDLIKIMNV